MSGIDLHMPAGISDKMDPLVIKQWFADRGDHTLRLDYPLTRDATVLDVGGYQGDWAALIHERYGCAIHIFEPVPIFADKIKARFYGLSNIHVHTFGLSDHSAGARILIDNDGSSVHRSKGTPCDIELRSANDIFAQFGFIHGIDLIKINIEGCEYELLEHFLDFGLIHSLRDIQVQFHDFVPDAARRMEGIQARLAKTHDLAWQYRFVWENWRRR